jgi:hypothetical protein
MLLGRLEGVEDVLRLADWLTKIPTSSWPTAGAWVLRLARRRRSARHVADE